MGGIFSVDGPLMQVLNKLADLLALSVLWLIGCLPVVTIGASTTALYYAVIKMIHGEGRVSSNFFKSYKQNLKQAIAVELIMAVAGLILFIDFRYAFAMQGAFAEFLSIATFCMLIIYAALLSYLFPLLSRFYYTTGVLFKNAALIALLNLPYTIVILLLNLLPWLLFFLRVDWVFRLMPVIVFLVPGLTAYVNSLMFLRIFRKYTPKEVLEEEEKKLAQ